MKNHPLFRSIFASLLLLVGMLAIPTHSWAGHKSEQELIAMLHSSDRDAVDAMDRLAGWYPKSTNAIVTIRGLLKDPRLQRPAARTLGRFHATLNKEDIDIIRGFLRSPDKEEIMDGLKALRGLNAPEAVPDIIPLLQEKDAHILRDSCRTLAVLGDKTTIPSLTPLVSNRDEDVRDDAKAAIKQLSAKP